MAPVLAAALIAGPVAEACTRAVNLGPEDRVLTGRSMDWKLPRISNLWVFPRGMERTCRGARIALGHMSLHLWGE